MTEENRQTTIDLEWDPYRTIFGLGKIGYTPPAAIGDILDNSVRAGAKKIDVQIIKRNRESLDLKKNNVKEYIIIDDGSGMDEASIIDALKLGSPNDGYEENSLSKFGLGLKSAAFSQGKELEIISAVVGGSFNKFIVSLNAIKKEGKYFATKVELNENDRSIISENLPAGNGTIVRIADISMTNHPSVKDTFKELEYRLGTIYYYFIKENGLQITIRNGEEVKEIVPYDVLFTDEANQSGNLDENEWEGTTVQWIKRLNDPILLDSEHDVEGTIEVTQLPHPPTLKLLDTEAKKYKIEAGNYGFYVYRNKRLISWAERFGGIIPLDQDYYSFRGRIIIDDSADEAFNIDVKKSSIVLSDEASNALNDLSADYKRKSKRAWNRAKELIKAKEGKEPNVTANKIMSDVDAPVFPGEKTEEEEKREKEKQQEQAQKMKKNIRKQAAEEKSERVGKNVKEEEVTEDEILETLKGTTNPDVNKIFQVTSINDNLLWEPYFDAENGQCVRINKNHRFAKLIFEDNNGNPDLQIILQVLLLNLAQSEFYARTSAEFDDVDIEKHLIEYRHIVSGYLTNLCRKKANELPPNNKELQ